MIYMLYSIHVIVSLFLILVVLLQQGKGADLSVFGGGSTQTAFGARGAATVLHKLTVVCFVAFIITTLGIAIMKNSGSSQTVISDDVVATEEEAPATEDDATTPDPAADDATATDAEAPAGDASSATGAEGEAAAEPGDEAGSSSDDR